MSVNLEEYKKYLEQPWGKIQYEITYKQLAHIKNKKVLDFGAGFGLTSEFLSKNNEVVAIEPNNDMLSLTTESSFKKVLGSLNELSQYPDHSFDYVICHNVLEYIEPNDRKKYLDELKRVMKQEGKLSIIKHNNTGKVIQSVVLENNISKALKLLEGKEFEGVTFSQGSSYTIEELIELSQMKLENYFGIRTFYGIQPNEFKTENSWLKQMVEIEMAIANLKPYKDISFLQHVWLTN